MQGLVRIFYHDLWNKADPRVAEKILSTNFRFRGSLGPEHVGRDSFLEYMRSVHVSLGSYNCQIDHLIATKTEAAARMTFSGIHHAEFMGIEATEKKVSWTGAAFFKGTDTKIASLWVLGDLENLRKQLE